MAIVTGHEQPDLSGTVRSAAVAAFSNPSFLARTSALVCSAKEPGCMRFGPFRPPG